MRLLPRSLFARLVLVLLIGLLLAQLISVWVLLRDRGNVAHGVLRAGLAQRVVTLVRLLDSMPPDQRAGVLEALSIPPLYMSLASESIAADTDPDTSTALARLLYARLREALPDETSLRVSAWQSEDSDRHPHHWPRRERSTPQSMQDRDDDWKRAFERRRHGPLSAFLIQVQLADGAWLMIDRRVPETVLSLPVRLLTTLVVLVLGMILVSLAAVRWLTRPLRTLAMAADDLGRNIDQPPLSETGPTEVARAAQAFNTMQRRLKRYIDDRARILTAVSHDLKTPITRLRLRAEMMDDTQLKQKITADLDDMETMVSATLDFMRSDGASEQTQPVDVTALLESLIEDAHDLGWEVRLEGRAQSPYPGKPLALKRCLNNLIENAIRYGKVATVVIDDRHDQLQILVIDQGEGIPEAELEQVFDPFCRREVSRARHSGGTGLGLGIARNIARAHGGDVTLANRRPQGLEATVTLPRADRCSKGRPPSQPSPYL